MLINLTNHPTDTWTELQLHEACKYGEIVDLPFPDVSDKATHEDVKDLVKQLFDKIVKLSSNKACTVHVMGEMTFTYAMVNMLKAHGYKCVASTSKRIVEMLPDDSKNVRFEFCQFREY